MKKFLAVVFVIAMLVSTPGSFSVLEAAEGSEFFVGLAFGDLDAVPALLMGHLTAAMDKLGWKYVITNADKEVNKYYADVENLCQQKPDIIVTRPPSDLATPSVVETAVANDVPIVLVGTMRKVEGQDYLGHVGEPETIRGIPLAAWLDEYVKKHPGFIPKIGFIVGELAVDARDLCERSLNIREHLKAEFVDVITAEADPRWTAAGGMKVTEDWLQRYTTDELNTILVWSDEMAIGVVQALQSAGKTPDDYLVLSYDGLPIIQENVSLGWVDASSGIDLKKQSDSIIEFCQKLKDGKKDELNFYTYTGSIFILDTENVKGIADGSQVPTYWNGYSQFLK